MYLKHFGIKQYPFSLTPDTSFYCNLPEHHAALNVLLFSLQSGEGFIKIIGEVGSGKTLLCRKLLDSLGDDYHTAYIPNPDLTPEALRLAFARELGIDVNHLSERSDLLQVILERLLQLHLAGKKVVLIVDEAQALSDESLEAVRLLTNLETESEKLLQIVLFAQPELDERLQERHLRQLSQRISFSHELQGLNRAEMDAYLCHRLAIAGHTQGVLFRPGARRLLYKTSRGTPRVVNILSHKAMLAAYGLGEKRISIKSVKRAINDSLDIIDTIAPPHQFFKYLLSFIAGVIVFGVAAFLYYHFV